MLRLYFTVGFRNTQVVKNTHAIPYVIPAEVLLFHGVVYQENACFACPSQQARNGARRYVRPLVLSALAGFAAYLLVYLLLAGDTAAILAPSGSPMVTLSTPGMDGARALREKAVALQKAATAVAERQEKADRDRAEMAERERKETAEQQRIATEKQAERERIEKAERAREEKAEQAQKEKVEQVRKEKAEREASERAQRERALEERQKRQLAKAASAKENAEAATKARAAQQRDEQALGVLFSLQTEVIMITACGQRQFTTTVFH